MSAAPESAITTHPVFVEAVGEIFKERGFPVYIADNPGTFGDVKNIERLYEDCGIKNVARECGFTLLYPETTYTVNEIPFSSWARTRPHLMWPAASILLLAVEKK